MTAADHDIARALERARVGTTRRLPDSFRAAGTQTWQDLLFVHWEVDERELRKIVPPQLELDTWDAKCLVGAVPFRMRKIRSWWMPRLFALNFLETNLRTYVRYRGLPGVYFLSLEASSRLAVRVARFSWGLPYWDSVMRFDSSGNGDSGDSSGTVPPKHHARCVRKIGGATLDVSFAVHERLPASQPGTLEHFLLERYLLFSTRGESVWTGQVSHTPYPAHRVEIESLQESLLSAAQLSPGKTPFCAHFSPGVDVEVFGPWPWTKLPAQLRELSSDALPAAGSTT